MSMFQDIKNGRFYLGDCLEVMKEIPDGVIDMILTDPPYGTTACAWDSIIPLEPMWEQLKRVIKPNGAIVIFGSEPFSSTLRVSNSKWYSYDWKWEKTKPVGHLNANRKPMNKYEDIIVFSKKQPTYNPQGLKAIEPRSITRTNKGGIYGEQAGVGSIQKFTGYPSNIIKFKSQNGELHPTQKPVDLMEYLIKTYTNEGELVLDNCAGSGTTAIAAENTGRKWVCIEQLEEYANKAVERILNHVPEVKPNSTIQIDDNIPIPEGEEDGNEAVDKVLSKIDKELMQTGCSHYEQKKEF